MKYRRRVQSPHLLMIVLAAVIVIVLVFFMRATPQSKSEHVVKQFYEYEQTADFGNSWELFHPLMKERFSKGNYIQSRNHVFVGHFGADTFNFTIGDADNITDWKMTDESPVLREVYVVPITQTYKSSFGTFTIHQEIFVAKEDGEYLILWSFQ